MKATRAVLAASTLAASLVVIAQTAQESAQRGYDDQLLFEGEVVVTVDGKPRTIGVSLHKFAFEGGGANVELALPSGKGVGIYQHRAGKLAMTIADERVEPLEGEWMTIGLDTSVKFATEDDSVIVDGIILVEK